MSRKLNDLAATSQLVAMPGVFPAIADFAEKFSAKEGPSVTLGTLGAALQSGNTGEFYSPVFPRGLRLNTGEEVFSADLDAQRVQILPAEAGEANVIVSRHPATITLLTERWPLATVFDGNVTSEEVTGKVVAGTLPPFLAAEAAAIIPVQVVNYDAAKEGDIDDERRIVIHDPIKVVVE